MTIQIKATEQYFPVVLFIMLYKVLTFEYVDDILKCERLSEKHCLLYIWDLTLSYFNSFWIDFGSRVSRVCLPATTTIFALFCENVFFTVNLTLISLRSEPLAFTKGY